ALQDRPGDELGGARRHGGLDQRQAQWRDLLADRAQRGFERAHLDLAGAHVAQAAFRVVALHVDHHAVRKLQAVAVDRGGQRLLLEDAPPDHRVDLGILGFHRRHAAIEHRNLPVAPRARALAADDELARLPALVGGVRDDRGHDGADEATPMTTTTSLPSARAAAASFSSRASSLAYSSFSGRANRSPAGLTEESGMDGPPRFGAGVCPPPAGARLATESAPPAATKDSLPGGKGCPGAGATRGRG